MGEKGLLSGDIIVTRHSNLADVHVVFHILLSSKLACTTQISLSNLTPS